MATSATPVDIFWSGIFRNGKPLSYGVVTVTGIGVTGNYLYTAADKSTNTGATFTLDADGRAEVWGDGEYQFDIVDQYGYPLAQSPFTNQTYRYLASTGSGLDAYTLQGIAPRTDIVGSPTGVIPVSDSKVNPNLVADFLNNTPGGATPTGCSKSADLAKVAGGNTFTGTQTITNTVISNGELDVNGVLKIQPAGGIVGKVLEATNVDGTAAWTSLPAATPTFKSFINHQQISVPVTTPAVYDSGALGITPISAKIFISTQNSDSGVGVTMCNGVANAGGSAYSGIKNETATPFISHIEGTSKVAQAIGNAGLVDVTVTQFTSAGVKLALPAYGGLGAQTIIYDVTIVVDGY
jgi:hypothetical protein